MNGLNNLLERLQRHNVEFVLIGAMAGIVHGASLMTQDLDVCCGFSEDNLLRIQAAVADLHPVHRSRPDLPLRLTPELCRTLKNLYLQTDLGVLDCLGEVRGLGDYPAVLAHSVVVDFDFGACRVLSLDGLIRAKESMGREKDQLALRELRALRERPTAR